MQDNILLWLEEAIGEDEISRGSTPWQKPRPVKAPPYLKNASRPKCAILRRIKRQSVLLKADESPCRNTADDDVSDASLSIDLATPSQSTKAVVEHGFIDQYYQPISSADEITDFANGIN